MANGKVLSSAPVAGDGTFQLAFQPTAHVSLQLVGVGKTQLVFPRKSGGLLTTVSVRSNGRAFDLGTVRYVGQASSKTFVFKSGPAQEAECEDGLDPAGNMCVEDDDADHGTCEAEDGDADEAEHDDSDADDHGEASDDVDDGLSDDGDAVAEHNFPADGCADDDEDETDDAQDD